MTTHQATQRISSERFVFLDWLRVIAIFVLLFYHTGMVFVGWGFHIENADIIESLRLPMDIAHRLRMPLLFVIAGAGLWYAMKNRRGLEVVRERSLRLLLPLIAGMILIVPPQVYFERLYRGQWDGSYVDFFLQRVLQLQPYPQGDLSWHHLWFVAYLYVYVLVMLPLLLWWRRTPRTIQPGAWIYSFGLLLGVNEAVLKPLFPESHNLVADWYVFNHYLLLTVFGFVLASTANAWDWIATRRRQTLATTCAIVVSAYLAFKLQIIQRNTPADALVANVFTWFAILAMLGYGRNYLSKSNRFIEWARDASYPIYILHQTFIIALAYYVTQQPWTAWSKYWLIWATTFVCCVVTYQLIVRRFALTRLLFGMKTQTPEATHAMPLTKAST